MKKQLFFYSTSLILFYSYYCCPTDGLIQADHDFALETRLKKIENGGGNAEKNQKQECNGSGVEDSNKNKNKCDVEEANVNNKDSNWNNCVADDAEVNVVVETHF